ncbi:hypothetical protein DIPPA_30344 [Diplonema papillatum]|nr:hypothetical protein DIPPA_30344 [Diplonema papillatum]
MAAVSETPGWLQPAPPGPHFQAVVMTETADDKFSLKDDEDTTETNDAGFAVDDKVRVKETGATGVVNRVEDGKVDVDMDGFMASFPPGALEKVTAPAPSDSDNEEEAGSQGGGEGPIPITDDVQQTDAIAAAEEADLQAAVYPAPDYAAGELIRVKATGQTATVTGVSRGRVGCQVGDEPRGSFPAAMVERVAEPSAQGAFKVGDAVAHPQQADTGVVIGLSRGRVGVRFGLDVVGCLPQDLTQAGGAVAPQDGEEPPQAGEPVVNHSFKIGDLVTHEASETPGSVTRTGRDRVWVQFENGNIIRCLPAHLAAYAGDAGAKKDGEAPPQAAGAATASSASNDAAGEGEEKHLEAEAQDKQPAVAEDKEAKEAEEKEPEEAGEKRSEEEKQPEKAEENEPEATEKTQPEDAEEKQSEEADEKQPEATEEITPKEEEKQSDTAEEKKPEEETEEKQSEKAEEKQPEEEADETLSEKAEEKQPETSEKTQPEVAEEKPSDETDEKQPEDAPEEAEEKGPAASDEKPQEEAPHPQDSDKSSESSEEAPPAAEHEPKDTAAAETPPAATEKGESLEVGDAVIHKGEAPGKVTGKARGRIGVAFESGEIAGCLPQDLKKADGPGPAEKQKAAGEGEEGEEGEKAAAEDQRPTTSSTASSSSLSDAPPAVAGAAGAPAASSASSSTVSSAKDEPSSDKPEELPKAPPSRPSSASTASAAAEAPAETRRSSLASSKKSVADVEPARKAPAPKQPKKKSEKIRDASANQPRPVSNPEGKTRQQLRSQGRVDLKRPHRSRSNGPSPLSPAAGSPAAARRTKEAWNHQQHQLQQQQQQQPPPKDKKELLAHLQKQNAEMTDNVATLQHQLEDILRRQGQQKADKAARKNQEQRVKLLEADIRMQTLANEALERRYKEVTREERLEARLKKAEILEDQLRKKNAKLRFDQRDHEKKLGTFADPEGVLRTHLRQFKDDVLVVKATLERMERQRQQTLAHATFQKKRVEQLSLEDPFPDVPASDLRRLSELGHKFATLNEEQDSLEYHLSVLRRQTDTSKRFAEVQKAAQEKDELEVLRAEASELRKVLGIASPERDSAPPAQNGGPRQPSSETANGKRPALRSRLLGEYSDDQDSGPTQPKLPSIDASPKQHQQQRPAPDQKPAKPSDEVSTDDEDYDDGAYKPSRGGAKAGGDAGYKPSRGTGNPSNPLFSQDDDGLPPLKPHGAASP